MKARAFIAGMVAAVVLVAALPIPAQAAPWYADVQTSLALYTEIRGMWQAGVTDGFGTCTGTRGPCYFYPLRDATREEFFAMTAKAFGLSPYYGSPLFRDYTPSNAGSNDMWGSYYPWVQAAGLYGIVQGSGGYLYPKNYITRAEAIAVLIRALELDYYANSLSTSEINNALSQFKDGSQVPSSLRRYAAAAIILGIWKGYGNGYLGPNDRLQRQHAAAFLYRSASLRISLSSNVLYQGGTVTIRLTKMVFANPTNWVLWIADSSGRTVKLWSGSGYQLPFSVSWDGRDYNGNWVSSGQYLVKAYMLDLFEGNYRYIEAAPKPITTYMLPPNRAPTADFTWSPSSVYAGTWVSFINLSTDPDGDPLTYVWEYQGPGDTTWYRFSTERTPSMSFYISGTWRIRLTVRDPYGLSSSITKSLYVQNVNRPPTADFSWTPTNPALGDTVQLINRSSDPDGDGLAYRWEYLRPGSSQWYLFSTQPNPSMVFDAVGQWGIRLTAIDPRGLQASITKYLTVMARLVPQCNPLENPVWAGAGRPVSIGCVDATEGGRIISGSVTVAGRTHNLVQSGQTWAATVTAPTTPGRYDATLVLTARGDTGQTGTHQVTVTIIVVPPNQEPKQGMDFFGPLPGVPGKVRLIE